MPVAGIWGSPAAFVLGVQNDAVFHVKLSMHAFLSSIPAIAAIAATGAALTYVLI
jgi:hypothetical protein